MAKSKVIRSTKRVRVTIDLNIPKDWTIGITESEIERILRTGLQDSDPAVGDQRMA